MAARVKTLALSLLALALLLLMARRIFALRSELGELADRHERNVAALTSELTAARLGDSLSMAAAAALELRARGAERAVEGLRAQLQALRIRARDARSVTTVETVVRDTVWFPAIEEGHDTVAADTCRLYEDRWVTMELCGPRGGPASVSYSVRDSVTTVIHVAYRRRFLWWRWRPEYRATVVSHNARSTITAAAPVVIAD